MKFFIQSCFVIFIMLFVGGCTQQVDVRFLQPAEIDRVSNTKKITVAKFQNDTVGLSNKIESQLSNHKIEGKNYFKVISRKDFDKIIAEQKLQNSGLVDLSNVVKVGELLEAQAMILGRVDDVGFSVGSFYEERRECVDKKCKELRKYTVECFKQRVSLSADIRIVDIQKGDIIYANTIPVSSTHKHCSDDSRVLPDKMAEARYLSGRIASRFVYKLMPHYRYVSVNMLEDADLDYTDKQEKLLEVALAYVEQKRYDKAQKFLIQLIDSTDQKSYVPFYNLGVLKEMDGDYISAKRYYKKADDLMVEPVEEINLALVRIDKLIQNNRVTKEQLSR